MSDTNTNSDTSTSNSSFTTVKTVYARAAVVLLALNFCLTGYVVLNMSESTQEQIEGLQTQSSRDTSPSRTVSSLDARTQTEPATPTTEVQTRENKTTKK